MTLDSYIRSLRGKTVSVVGLGVSNRPLLRLLRAQGFGDLEITKDLHGIPRVVSGALWGGIWEEIP